MKKPIPEFLTDADAERFVDEADLSEHDLAGFVPRHFEFQPKAAQLNMRLPASLLAAVKAKAKARGIPYTRFVREALEHAVNPARKAG
jgi:predicted DNA binding CopG/RHH family protein